jgi:hypothetical protein
MSITLLMACSKNRAQVKMVFLFSNWLGIMVNHVGSIGWSDNEDIGNHQKSFVTAICRGKVKQISRSVVQRLTHECDQRAGDDELIMPPELIQQFGSGLIMARHQGLVDDGRIEIFRGVKLTQTIQSPGSSVGVLQQKTVDAGELGTSSFWF